MASAVLMQRIDSVGIVTERRNWIGDVTHSRSAPYVTPYSSVHDGSEFFTLNFEWFASVGLSFESLLPCVIGEMAVADRIRAKQESVEIHVLLRFGKIT